MTLSPRHAEPAASSVGELVKEVSTNVSTLIQGEIALAKLELKSTVKNVGVGAVFLVLAAAIALFALPFAFIAIAEGLVAAHIWRWAAYLIVFGFFILVAVLLMFLGIKKVKKAKAPERTIATTKDTVAYLKDHPKA